VTRRKTLFGRIFLYRRGRVAALSVLAVFAIVLLLAETRLDRRAGENGWVDQLAVGAAPAAALRQQLFDAYQRVFPRIRKAQSVAVVEIDEESLKSVGQWPWPRSKLAELIDAIARYQPVAIGLDIYMPEADQTSPEQVAGRLGPDQAELAGMLRRLPAHDDRLARSLQAAPTVLGAAGFDFQTFNTSVGLRTTPLLLQGEKLFSHLRHYPFVLSSLPQLQSAARGQALVTVENSAIVRRIPLVAAVGTVATPSLAMEMLRVASGTSALTVVGDSGGVRSVAVAELSVPTQPGGDLWMYFAKEDPGRDRRSVSAQLVLAGMAPADLLESKLVLIGLTGLGLSDQRVTARREFVPGIEIQAQLLESLLDGRFLLRPRWMPALEVVVLLMLGGLTIWLVPLALARRDAGGNRRPGRVGWWVSGVCLCLVGVGIWLFLGLGWLFDGASMSLALASVLASLVSSSTLEVDQDNRRLAAVERDLREDAARLAGEMEAARRIQLGSLPDAHNAFPGERRFVVDALIEPAREVGGALYDFCMVDHRRLCFLIGDVSGKGVPASLFMAVTKTLSRSFATRLPGGAAAIMSAANLDLSRGNVETLFVTMLFGVLDVESGALELVNAGHDAPWCMREQGGLEQLQPSSQAGGPPLCVVDDFSYVLQRFQLAPGDRLCMVTDGITEAANHAGDLYGSRRLQAALALLAPQAPAEAIVRSIRQDVADFVAGAEASDDMAILVLHWRGPADGGAPPGPGPPGGLGAQRRWGWPPRCCADGTSSAVGTAGSRSPRPAIVISDGWMPACNSRSRTVSARWIDKRSLSASEPTRSVCPITVISGAG